MSTLDRREGRERGQATIELIGFVVAAVLVTLLVVQGVFAAQSASVAQEAARNGARAMSQGEDWHRVVRETLPDWAHAESVRGGTAGGAARVEVSVRIPIGLHGITSENIRFTRDAEFPVETSWG